MWWRRNKKQVAFEDVFIDAANVSALNVERMEGRMELPLQRRSIVVVGMVYVLVVVFFVYKLFALQVLAGEEMYERSEKNTIREAYIIAERGVVRDRHGELLAWNEKDHTGAHSFPVRAYTDRGGLGQLIGFVSYPKRDKQGFYFRTEYLGRNGVEETYTDVLSGENGTQLVEVDALGEVVSNSVVFDAAAGEELVLSIDAKLSEGIHDIIATSSREVGFRSGAAAIMDIHTGEIVALTSFPSYDPEVMADGADVDLITAYNEDERLPFLNKVIGGVYTPGSIVKPFLAYAALAEDVISPNKIIVSTGEIVIPNRYNPDNPSIFTDWRAHGAMDMREAIAFSSNVYFYIIGGGFEGQSGLGISRINQYMQTFGFGETTGFALSGEKEGVVPSPEWKEEVFADDWRLGDTYLTSIGQFGFQVTPLQMLKAYGAIANDGVFREPHVVKGQVSPGEDRGLDPELLEIVKEGMRMTVTYPGGTARALERDDIAIAGKSGTAELDSQKKWVNSWIAGFFPYEEPQYAFILLMERGPRSNITVGASTVMGRVFDWMSSSTPEYLGLEE